MIKYSSSSRIIFSLSSFIFYVLNSIDYTSANKTNYNIRNYYQRRKPQSGHEGRTKREEIRIDENLSYQIDEYGDISFNKNASDRQDILKEYAVHNRRTTNNGITIDGFHSFASDSQDENIEARIDHDSSSESLDIYQLNAPAQVPAESMR